MTENKRPATRLRKLIADQGWSLSALSMAAGLGKGAVSDLLKHPERQPREKTLRALAHTLSVDPAYLAGRTDEPQAGDGLTEGTQRGLDLFTDGVEDFIALQKGRLRAFHTPGNRGSETIIVDTSQTGESGQMILVDDASGASMQYLVEPYLIRFDRTGHPSHTLKRPETPVLGRVLAVIRHY